MSSRLLFFFTRVRIQHLSFRVLFFKKPSYSILVVKGELRPAPLFVLIMGPGTCVELCHSNVMRAADVEILFLLISPFFFFFKELHRRGGRGIVQDAVLIGTPVTGNPSEWRPLLDVVAGQLVNAFSRYKFLTFYYVEEI